MKRIAEYRKLFDINEEADLAKIKSIYKNLMKDWHPDKFTEEEKKAEAEAKSKTIINAYHFLVSINEETHRANLEEYTDTTTNAAIEDYVYKGVTLKITYQDGITFEYFGVPKNVYNKFNSSPTPARFARRHICHSYTFRNVSKNAAVK